MCSATGVCDGCTRRFPVGRLCSFEDHLHRPQQPIVARNLCVECHRVLAHLWPRLIAHFQSPSVQKTALPDPYTQARQELQDWTNAFLAGDTP
jgi:hypothetical protein